MAAFFCPEVAEVKQQRMESLANCESEKAWTPGEGLDREDLKRTTVTPQEGWTVRTSRGLEDARRWGWTARNFEETGRTPEEECEEQIVFESKA